jgi:hypothetical protein
VALRRAYHSPKESYRLCKKNYETEEVAWAQQRAVQPLMNELMNVVWVSNVVPRSEGKTLNVPQNILLRRTLVFVQGVLLSV